MEQYWADQEATQEKKADGAEDAEMKNEEAEEKKNEMDETQKGEAPAEKAPVIAKITKDSEFSYVCRQLDEKAKSGVAEAWELSSLKQKLQVYIRR